MFYGEYSHSLDKKNRVIIPSKMRDALKEQYVEKLYMTRGLEQCLFVFPQEEWNRQETKFKNISFTHPDARKFNRLFFSGAFETVFDIQGRILIPQYLKEFARIDKDIMIIGVSNRFEIWSIENWKSFYKNSINSFEDIAEKLLNLEA